jgi:hypothetical protein
MSLARAATRWGSVRLMRRASRSIPYFGAALALAMIGRDMRRKGVVGGFLNVALDATPFVGAAKNAVEAIRGDFIPDRNHFPRNHQASSRAAHRSPEPRTSENSRTTEPQNPGTTKP